MRLGIAKKFILVYNIIYKKFNLRKAQIKMSKLRELIQFQSGSPQFRITETFELSAPVYVYYSQTDLTDDLAGILSSDINNKKVRTKDTVNTLMEGDLLFSLISGTATIVSKEHEGYLYTQNYVKMMPDHIMDPRFLVYLINENILIKKQFNAGLQGSQVIKYTLKQLKEIELPKLPSVEKQRMIGEIYFKQLRLKALKKRVAELENIVRMEQLQEAMEDE